MNAPFLGVCLGLLLASCDSAASATRTNRSEDGEGAPIEPPFEVRGDLQGLLLVYFDEEGPHTAENLEEIPTERRHRVRVDSLTLPPDQRDPDSVYLADLREARPDGSYEVRRLSREAFDRLVDSEAPPPEPVVELASAEVVLYGASWCGACRQAKAHFERRGIPFVEKDIERDDGARAEMQRKAQAAGVRPTGIPVIDFRGTILTGYDPGTIDRLDRESRGATI